MRVYWDSTALLNALVAGPVIQRLGKGEHVPRRGFFMRGFFVEVVIIFIGRMTGIFRPQYLRGFHARSYMCAHIHPNFFVSFVCFCSFFPIGVRQDHAHDTIDQLHFMDVDDQPERNIQQFHVAQHGSVHQLS